MLSTQFYSILLHIMQQKYLCIMNEWQCAQNLSWQALHKEALDRRAILKSAYIMVASKMKVLCVYHMNMGLKAREMGTPTLLVPYLQF